MADIKRFLPTVLALSLLGLGALGVAQPETLQLDFEHVYLSDLSRGLEGLTSYRQRYLETTEGGETESRYEWTSALAASGDRFTQESMTVPMPMTRANYEVGGGAFFYAEMGEGEVVCTPLPQAEPLPPMTQISDTTGFQTATLVGAGETVNGVLADRYRLEPPPIYAYYDEGSLSGELWVAREGGYLVKYEVTGRRGDETTTWSYDLTDVNGPVEVQLPAACSG